MRWIIGDIHGMYLPLVTLLDEIHHRDAGATLFFCGDYVNRGPDSRRVIELLLSLKTARFCRGNHDDALDLVLSGTCFAPSAQLSGVVITFDHFLRFGLDQTLHSYGIDARHIEQARAAGSAGAITTLLEAIPEEHRDFVHRLPVVQSEPEFFVVHAKWDCDEPPGVPSFMTQFARSQRTRHDVIWGRYTVEEIGRDKKWDRPAFVGHTPVTTYRRGEPVVPLEGQRLYLLDTGAAVSLDGRLTAWCFEEGNFVQADRDGELSL